jgi:hypothetical protein
VATVVGKVLLADYAVPTKGLPGAPERGTVVRQCRRHGLPRTRTDLGIKNFTPITHAEVIGQMDAAFGSRMVPIAAVPDLLAANETNLINRPPASIWGMFGEPTPSLTNYATGLLTVGPQNIEQFMFNVYGPVQDWMRVNFKNAVNLVTADWYQEFWPAGSTFARDSIGAVYETLGSRLAGVGAGVL